MPGKPGRIGVVPVELTTEQLEQDDVGGFYAHYHDRIAEKRFNSPFWLRRYAHRTIHSLIASHIRAGATVLDAGCGEGILSLLLARNGALVTGMDISGPNIAAAQEMAREASLNVRFVVGDGLKLPFGDDSFDVVVSSHVIEHLTDPIRGLRELHRVSRGMVVLAMPTCLNPAAWALLGRDAYWKLTRRSAWAVPLGLGRTVVALALGREGVDEGYAGQDDLPHVWRFPWVMAGMAREAGFRVSVIEAGPLLLPYAAQYSKSLRRIQPKLDRLGSHRLIRNLGFGTHLLAEKQAAFQAPAPSTPGQPE